MADGPAENDANGEPDSGGSKSVVTAAQTDSNGAPALRTGLLIDWGGVLTSNLFVSFNAHCVASGIEPETLRERFRGDRKSVV